MKQISCNVPVDGTVENTPMDMLDILNQATDTGYVDTASFILDMITWSTDKAKREHIKVNGSWILKPSLIAEMLISRLLSFDFEESGKMIKGNGKKIWQKYWVNNSIDGVVFYYNPMRFYLSIFVDHNTLQGKSQVEVTNYIKDIFQSYFLFPQKYVDRLDRYIKLSRCDFKRDYRCRDEQELVLIKEIINIAPNSIVGKHYIKVDEKDEHDDWDNFDDYAYMQKYKTEANDNVEFVIYDKQLEQESKFREGKITQEELDYYEKVIRFEIRIKDKKLNNLKSNLGISKELDNYKDEQVADEYFSKYAELCFFTEPFYRIDKAKRIINKSSLKPKTKKKLGKLITSINKDGYTYTQEHYAYKGNTFRDHIKKLRSLGINPLTFSDIWKDKQGKKHKTKYTKIPNFIKKQNCLEEEGIIPSKFNELKKQAKVIDKS